MKDDFVLDTSAVMTFLENEAGADRVDDLFEQAETGVINFFLSFVTFTAH